MLITNRVFQTPVPVVAIFVPRMRPWPPLSSDVQFDIYNGEFIEAFRESEASVVDLNISNFVFIDGKWDESFVFFMWKPIADTGLWADMREFIPSGLKILHALMKEYR